MRALAIVLLFALTGCATDNTAYKAVGSQPADQPVADRYGNQGSSRSGTAVRSRVGSSVDLLAWPGRQSP